MCTNWAHYFFIYTIRVLCVYICVADYDGNWTVSAKLADDRTTSKAVLSWHDKQALFTSKTATKEQLAARYLNTEIKEMQQEKVSAKQAFSR